jgi:IS30 family transposase
LSHEYVYELVRRDKKRGGTLYRRLKRFGRRKQRFGARDDAKEPAASDRIRIDERPAVVDKRSRLGDLEADLIIGHQGSVCVLNVLDRKSRKVALRRLSSKRMNEVRQQEEVALEDFPIRHTLTNDNGTEFNAHKLDEIASLLNNRPRKCLGYLTPNEVHAKESALRTLNKRWRHAFFGFDERL